MQPHKRISLTLMPIMLLGLAGCAHYNARPLIHIAQTRTAQKEQIILDYRIFNGNDCKQFFDRNIISAGYQPIQIMIHNNSARYLSLNLNRCNVPIISPDDIAKRFHTSTKGRVAGYGIAFLFFWPFAIPAIVDGIGSSKANKKLDEDFARKSLRDQTISPYSSVNGVIFVPTNIRRSEISLTLIDQQSGEPFVLSTEKTSVALAQ